MEGGVRMNGGAQRENDRNPESKSWEQVPLGLARATCRVGRSEVDGLACATCRGGRSGVDGLACATCKFCHPAIAAMPSLVDRGPGGGPVRATCGMVDQERRSPT